MNNYENQGYYTQQPYDNSLLLAKTSAVMKQVYVRMFLGLLATAFTAYFCANSFGVIEFFFTNSWAMWVLVAAELAIVFGVSGAINKLNSTVATLLFFLFAVINGLMLFPVLLIYTGVSVAKTFFITAGVFGAMSVYGYFTSKDLTRWGSILFMALIGLIICSVVNIFLKSSGMEWIISLAGVVIFVGLTAWDTQQIKAMAQQTPMESTSKLATLGALSLYLDFINLFLYLLRVFGNSRD